MNPFAGFFVPGYVDAYGMNREKIESACRNQCRQYHPDNWPNNHKDFKTRQLLRELHVECMTKCRKEHNFESGLSPKTKKSRQKLIDLLGAACGKCELCDGCTQQMCEDEAQRIADAIFNTIDHNWGDGRFWDYDAWGVRSDAQGGYLCHDWAYAIKDAFDLTKSKCFKGKIIACDHKDNEDYIHFYVEIGINARRGCHAFVDDNFRRKIDDFTTKDPPLPKGYFPSGGGLPNRRGGNQPVPVDEDGIPHPSR